MSVVVLGLDPGTGGAVALFDETGDLLEVVDMRNGGAR